MLAEGHDSAPFATGTLNSEDGTRLGDFAVEITVPTASAGHQAAIAWAGREEASDDFQLETKCAPDDTTSATATPTPTPGETTPVSDAAGGTVEAAAPLDAAFGSGDCTSAAARRGEVRTAAELAMALGAARPGDLIHLADGTYGGTFVAATSGAAAARIALSGLRRAVIDGGDVGNGYALHITGDYWTVAGITVTNALEAIVLDDADFTVLDHLAVHTIGHEAVHFRTHCADNVIQDSDSFDTGLNQDKFGEGVSIGSSVSNRSRYTNGEADRSDRNRIRRNRIWHTTAEAIDVKGNGYLIRGSTGTNSPTDGFQTHVINDRPWGRDNVSESNVAAGNGGGYSSYVHDPDESNNVVGCDNQVSGAAAGFANVACVQASDG